MKYKKNIYLFILLFGLSLNFSSIVFAENEVTETQVSVELKQPISTKYHLPGTYNNGNELKKNSYSTISENKKYNQFVNTGEINNNMYIWTGILLTIIISTLFYYKNISKES